MNAKEAFKVEESLAVHLSDQSIYENDERN